MTLQISQEYAYFDQYIDLDDLDHYKDIRYQDIALDHSDQPTPISVFSKKDAYPFRKCQNPLDRLAGVYINYYEIINSIGAGHKISNRRAHRDFQLAVEAASKKPALTNRDRRNEITNIVAIYNLDNEDALLAELDYLSTLDTYALWDEKKALLIDFAHKYDVEYERTKPDFKMLEAQLKDLEEFATAVENHYGKDCTDGYTFEEIKSHYDTLEYEGHLCYSIDPSGRSDERREERTPRQYLEA